MRFSLNSFIYKHVIDRILRGGQKSILPEVGRDDRVLDIACGTGSLSLAMAGRAKEVRGFDLSEEIIALAQKERERLGLDNVAFEVRDASELSEFRDKAFDLAVTSMSVHQFDPELAISILKEMRRIAGRVIIMDYNHPMRAGIGKLIINLIEWIAGGDHFASFKKFKARGGLDFYIEAAGLSQSGEDLYKSSSFRVVKCL